MMMSTLYEEENTLSLILIAIAQWNNVQFAGRHVTPLGHIILIPSPSVLLFNAAYLVDKQQMPIFDRGLNPRYTALEATTITITSPIASSQLQ